jgi:hypothetical protein
MSIIDNSGHLWCRARLLGRLLKICDYISSFYVLCCPIMYLYVLSSVLWCPLRFLHKNDVRFVFTSSCFAWCLMSYLRDLCLLAYSGVCFLLLVFVLCLMWPVLPVSLDCPFRCSLTFIQQITYICAIK